uniref:Putative eel-fucolectin tachylectin-4 pentaxrin-1 domain protein n=1 Tax=Rhipicephalus microplus TaxID=6941 RepID=A0A6M2D4S0_RHIMP
MQLRTLLVIAALSHLACGLCERPKGLPNAGEFFSSSVFSNGTTVDYVCDPGYDLLGIHRRTCHSNGTWLPAALPFCVTDVAKGKPLHTTSTTSSISNTNNATLPADDYGGTKCTIFKRGKTHFWYVDLAALYQVQVLRFDFGTQANTTNVFVDARVGESFMELAKNPVCSEYTGTLPYKSLYLPCVKTLRGSYVLVHLLSSTPLELSVCGFQVLSDVAVPVAERIRPTKSPTANHNESSADDGSFESYPFSKKVAVFVGVITAVGGVGSSALCLLIFLSRCCTCRMQQPDDAFLEQDATTSFPSEPSPETQHRRRRRHRMTSSTSSDQPTLLSVVARRSTMYCATRNKKYPEVPQHDETQLQDVSTTSADSTLPVPEGSPLTRKLINYHESRLL